MSEFTIKYQIITSENDAEALARKIAIEQSVETPESLISQEIENTYVGKSSLSRVGDDVYTLALTYHEAVLSRQLSVVKFKLWQCGNVSKCPSC